ncbi:hypothetical protein DITRI_Ditri05aG0078900 [Diplodiscus trichospermus]
MALRDFGGQVVACRTATYPTLLPVREAEERCLLEALSRLLSMGFKDVIFETDIQVVVNAIQFPQVDLSEFGSLIASCISQLSIELPYNVSFVMRQANKFVHALARAAFLLRMTIPSFLQLFFCASPTIWMTIPSFLSYLISNIVTILHMNKILIF